MIMSEKVKAIPIADTGILSELDEEGADTSSSGNEYNHR